MEKLPRAGYSPEFREQAVWTYQESGLSVAEVAKRLSLPKSSLNHWVTAARKGKLASVGKNQKPISELEIDLSRLKSMVIQALFRAASTKRPSSGLILHPDSKRIGIRYALTFWSMYWAWMILHYLNSR